MDMNFDDRMLVRGRQVAEPIAEGSEEGTVKLEMPVPHVALWGQPLHAMARQVDWGPSDVGYSLAVTFSTQSVPQSTSGNLDAAQPAEGDSFLKGASDLEGIVIGETMITK